MVSASGRAAGSTAEFEDDWSRVLESDDPRYFVFPSQTSSRQADLLEWIKAQQILNLLRGTGIISGQILEYGCGAAGISLYLAEHGYEAHICDLSIKALEVARRNQVRHAPGVELASSVSANALQLPYGHGSFDVVMSFGLLEHFESGSLDRLLEDVIRVLKPGGMFIADIVPGPERLNARTFGIIASYLGSLVYHLVSGRWQRARKLRHLYFDYFFENSYDDTTWASVLQRHGLLGVTVGVCRPFPPLALAGGAERIYTGLMRRLLGFHQRFDNANNRLTRRWGWMYLTRGWKPQAENS